MNTAPAVRETPLGTLRLHPRSDSLARAQAMTASLDAALSAPPHFVPTRERPCPVMRGRGVTIANCFDAAGNPMVQAVGDDGRIVAWIPWTEDRELADVEAQLWAILDTVTSLR
jgi:hypothetical protein